MRQQLAWIGVMVARSPILLQNDLHVASRRPHAPEGKERVLRFPRISRFIGRAKFLGTCLGILTLAGLTGCQDWNPIEGYTPQSLNPSKGFIDPSETSVTAVNAKRGPLLVPIL